MNIPPHMWGYRLSKVTESIRPVVSDYCDHLKKYWRDGEGFYISGLAGAGKTGAAVVILRCARTHNLSCTFITMTDLRECVRGKVAHNGELSVLDRCKTVDFFVLDSLCVEDAKDLVFGAHALRGLLESRIQAGRVTLITSSMSREQLVAFPYLKDWAHKLPMLPVEGPNRNTTRASERESSILKLMGK